MGGIEVYLGMVVPVLARAGQTVAFWHELDEPETRDPIELPSEVPTWSVAELGRERALAALR